MNQGGIKGIVIMNGQLHFVQLVEKIVTFRLVRERNKLRREIVKLLRYHIRYNPL